MEKWSKEKAWEWYNNTPWIRGYCGCPQNCVNRLAMWQEYGHEEVVRQMEYEFDLARKTGLNAVRCVLSFETWLHQHDSFMRHLEEYIALAYKYGLKQMMVMGNDCCVPKAFFKPAVFGEQRIDWGWHGGVAKGAHSGIHKEPGYLLSDEEPYRTKYLEMVREIAARYAKDERVQIWNVWNEIGNSRRNMMSVGIMTEIFEIIRSYDPIQPLTAECWSTMDDFKLEEVPEQEKIAMELSDIISFHCYKDFSATVKAIEGLKSYGRPIINSEWLNRIEHNNINEIFPLFYLEKIGSYHWGLIQGYAQTYEPWGRYTKFIDDPDYQGPFDLTVYQHDLYRFNGHPYIAKEIEIIKEFSRRADERFAKEHEKA